MKKFHYAPFIIGGMGGSGTRVVARVLEVCGIHLGFYNTPWYDSLCFQICGHWTRFGKPHEQLKFRISIFEKLHRGLRLSIPEFLFVLAFYARRPELRPDGLRPLRLLHAHPEMTNHCWGFKNPQSQFFVSQLSRHYSDCFYIHVIRHGLDMAYSRHYHQLRLYGRYWDITCESDEVPTAQQLLEYWIRTNQFAIEHCKTYLPDRHYIVYLDRLCLHPDTVIKELLQALRIHCESLIPDLAKIITRPKSLEQYVGHDLSIFSEEQLQAVRQLGFTIKGLDE